MDQAQHGEIKAKAAYRRPELTRYGTVSELTLQLAGRGIDDGAGVHKPWASM